MLPILAALMMPLCLGGGVADEGKCEVSHTVMFVDGAGNVTMSAGKPMVAWTAGGPPPAPAPPAPPEWVDAGDREILVEMRAQGELPRVWLGVRITAVPAPLAAHIGEDGVMINNVVVNSPADRAGLQQYDVVVRYDDVDIEQPQDLTAAIVDAEPGEQAKLTIIRFGQRDELRIRPIERPTDIEWQMKYDEPESMLLKDALEFRGRALRMGPDGKWIMQDLGDLPNLEDVFSKLDNLDFKNFNIELDAEDLFPHFEMRVFDGEDDEVTMFFSGGDDAADGRSEFRIEVIEDGARMMLHRDADGLIHVTRVDEDGEEVTETYEDPEVLAAEDPEAYELYEEHLGDREFTIFRRVEPGSSGAHQLQQRFQINVRERVEEALQRAREAQEQAQLRAQEAYEDALERAREVEELMERVEEEERLVEEMEEEAVELEGETRLLSFGIDEAGSISVTIVNENGEVEELAYESAAAFKAAEPELYERVKRFLE